jgi:hypothetical protein
MKRFTIIFAFLSILSLSTVSNAIGPSDEFEIASLRRQQAHMESQLHRQSMELDKLRTEIATLRIEMGYKCRGK